MPLGSYLAQHAAAQRASQAPAKPKEDDNGFLPQLGLTTAFKELGLGVQGLLHMGNRLAHGDASVLGTAAKGLTSSVLGTVSTALRPIGIPSTDINLGDKVIEPLGEALTGSKPKDFLEKARERGILPALIEDVGNVAMVGGAVKGALTAGAKTAAAAGDLERAAALTARASRMEKFAHPYKAVGTRAADLTVAARRAQEAAPLAEAAAGAAQAGTDATRVDEAVRSFANTEKAAAAAVDEAELASAPKGFTPDEASKLDAAVESARANLAPPEKLAEIAARVEPSAWSQRVVQHLPDVVNRTLASMEPMVTNSRLRAVERELSRHVRMGQKLAQSSEAVQSSLKVAEDILAGAPELKLDRHVVSQMVGEEVAARLDGTQWMETMLRDGGTPEAAAKMRDLARRGYRGITDEVRAALPPETLARLDQSVDVAAEAWRGERRAATQQLLASAKGAKGLEHAVLETDAPLLTRGELKAYRAAQEKLRRAEVLRARIPDERTVQGAQLARARAGIAFHGEKVGELQRRLGEASQRTADLHAPLPKGLAQIEASVSAILDEVAATGGTTFDVGTGKIERATSGFAVGLGAPGTGGAELFDIPMEQFTPNASAIIKDALESNQDQWAFDRNRLGLWTYTDANGIQRVAGDISYQASSRAEALVVGEAYRQKAIWDFSRGSEVELSNAPVVQDLMAHYIDDAVNPRGHINRLWGKIEKASDLTPEQIDDAMRVWLHFDYAVHRGSGAEVGSFLKAADVQAARRVPTVDHLAQTVLNLSTEEATRRALGTLSPKQVSDAMAWYYDSHDYIESAWRGQNITLLDGTVRDGAEVFYDLLAVTSVMASPKQNLGRALSGLANMDEFLTAQGKAAAAAKALMKRISEIEPGAVKTQHADVLAARAFDEIPELRALTDKTSMVYYPKENVLAILTGKLNLAEATTEDIARAAEQWRGTSKSLSGQNLPRAGVSERLTQAGLGDHPYVSWQQRYDDMAAARSRVKAAIADGTPRAQAAQAEGFKTFAEMEKAWKAVKAEESTVLDAAVAPHHDAALMEYHGSNALAKLRSFRDNLARPAESTAVTLDSVMARLYDIDSTDWAGGNTYGRFAEDVRRSAEQLTEQLGRDVRPHEVQALLWVFAKMEVGRQDWGRLLFAHDEGLDTIARSMKTGSFQAAEWDPLAEYWDQELAYSEEAAPIRAERRQLTKDIKSPAIMTGDAEAARLAELQSIDVKSPRSEQVMTARDRADLNALPEDTSAYQFEERRHVPYDAKKLAMKQEQYQLWQGTLGQIKARLANNDVTGAQRLLTEYVTGRKRSIVGDAGGSFQVVGEEAAADASTSAAEATAKLKAKGRHAVPAPRDWKRNYVSPLAARYNRAHGLPMPKPLDLTQRVLPERTMRVADAVEKLVAREKATKALDMQTAAQALREMSGTDASAFGELTKSPEQLAAQQGLSEIAGKPAAAEAAPLTPRERAQAERSFRSLQKAIDQQYDYMTKQLGVKVEYVSPDQEYASFDELAADVRDNNRLKVRSTKLAGDGPNRFMAETAPDGLQYNDKLRAVHDYFGHVQAMNDFDRHGENIAQRLHLQMLPEEAHGAAITEFRAQTSYLVKNGSFLDEQLTGLLPEEMRTSDYMVRGDIDELHQAFMGKLRGALTLPEAGRPVVKLFEGAGLDTLVHEGGHLLRQMLPEADMRAIEAAFPGISGKVLTDAKRSAEEAFVASMMTYLKTNKAVPGLERAFSTVAATLDEVAAPMLGSVYGPLTDDVRGFWDRTFQPTVVRPDKLTDPLQRTHLPNANVETKKFRWESDAEFARRTRQYGEARQERVTLRNNISYQQQLKAKYERMESAMLDAMDRPTAGADKAARLEQSARGTFERIASKVEARVPANPAWQPMHDAWRKLRAEAEANPELAQYMEDIPDNFADVIALAHEKGFNPEHIKDVGWERAQNLLFGHLTVGRSGMDTLIEAGSRKGRTGALQRVGAADRSIEALASATVEAMHERLSNYLVQHIEENYARPVAKGSTIPEGWVAWAPERTWVLTGTRPTTEALNAFAAADGVIIPRNVQKALVGMSKRYDHWAFHAITRTTAPWRTFMLTLSPKWYINNFIGNAILATTEGVRLADWRAAWQSYRKGTLPREVVGQSITAFEEGSHSLIHRSVRDTLQAEGKKAAWKAIQVRLGRANGVVDEIARTAVFEKHLRTGATREHALRRAYEAMVDYGDMTAFERGVVRSVIPFYSWQKGMLKLLARFPTDHPYATVIFQQLGLMQEEVLRDQLGTKSIPDAYLGLVGNANLRAFNPFLDAGQLTNPQGIAASVAPFADVVIRDAYHAPEGPPTGYELGPTGAAVPNVDITSEIANTLRGLPQVRLGEQTVEGQDVYGQSPGIGEAIGRFGGVPRTYDETDIAKIRARIEKAQKRTAG